MSILKEKREVVNALEAMKAAQKEWEEACRGVEKELDDANAKVVELKAAREAAADANDLKAFQKATAELVSAETTVEMAEMRFNRIHEKGFADEKMIDAAVRMYEDQIRTINAKACKAIFDQVGVLIQTVNAANAEARQLLKNEKELCDLCNVTFKPASGSLISDSTIYAAQIVNQFRLRGIHQDSNLRRYSSYADKD
ncbi:MAG: hypothetical protein K6A68_09735 [Clostridiales bacterium]|nr:hypothetical protein [Clostridiales bacterium]